MSTPKRPRSSRLTALLLIAVLGIFSSACRYHPIDGFPLTDLRAFNALHGSNVSPEAAKTACETADATQGPGTCQRFIEAINTARLNELARAKFASIGGLTDAQLARLAKCESGGNPRARSSSGRYTGLYQFDRSTWNGVARRIAPEYIGVLPGDAPPYVQHAMARRLYKERGRRPWPICGRRI